MGWGFQLLTPHKSISCIFDFGDGDGDDGDGDGNGLDDQRNPPSPRQGIHAMAPTPRKGTEAA